MKRIPVPTAAFPLAAVSLLGATAATLGQDATSQDASAAVFYGNLVELCATSGIGQLSMARASDGIALNWSACLALTVWTPACEKALPLDC